MHELVVIGLVALQLGLGYGFVYPKFAGDNQLRLLWLDVLTMVIALGLVGLLYADKNLDFSLIFFDTEWWIFTIAVGAIMEVPLYLRYTRQRNMKHWNTGKIYWIEGVSEQEVKQALTDTKYNRFRTRNARIVFVGLSLGSVAMVYVSAFLGASGKLSTYLEGIGFLGMLVFYLILRSSVRMVAEAPGELLDERQIAIRNHAYLLSYRTIFIPLFGLLILQLADLEMTFFGDPKAGVVDGGALFIGTAMLMATLPSIFVAIGDKGEDGISVDVSGGGNRL